MTKKGTYLQNKPFYIVKKVIMREHYNYWKKVIIHRTLKTRRYRQRDIGDKNRICLLLKMRLLWILIGYTTKPLPRYQ